MNNLQLVEDILCNRVKTYKVYKNKANIIVKHRYKVIAIITIKDDTWYKQLQEAVIKYLNSRY